MRCIVESNPPLFGRGFFCCPKINVKDVSDGDFDSDRPSKDKWF